MKLLIATVFIWIGILYSMMISAQEGLRTNRCQSALNSLTDYQATSVYGSSVEREWSTAAMYVLKKEMERYKVLKQHLTDTVRQWRFDVFIMEGGKIMAFVYEQTLKERFCNGPNAFFVKRKVDHKL